MDHDSRYVYHGSITRINVDKSNMKDSSEVREYDGSSDDSKKKTFKRLMVRFADKTSMTGVAYINTATLNVSKLLWSLLLLVAMAAMTIHLYFLIKNFYDWPSTAKIELGFANLPFPEVTICNTNPMHKTRLERFRGAPALKLLLRKMEPSNLVPQQFDERLFKEKYYDDNTPTTTTDNPDVPDITTGGYQSGTSTQPSVDTTISTANNGSGGSSNDGTVQPPPAKRRKKRFADKYGEFNLKEYDSEYDEVDEEKRVVEDYEYDQPTDNQTKVSNVYKRLYMAINKTDRAHLGHNISDMLLSCSFNGRVCDSSQFRLHQTSTYGNCWTLTSERFTVLDSGPSGGLTLILYLETTEYIYGITQGYGINLQISQRGTYPDPYQEGILIPASMETDIGLKTIFIERLGNPHGDCESGEAFKQRYRRTYTRRSCQQICRVTQVIDTCGCYDEQMEVLALDIKRNSHVCFSINETRCMATVNRMFDIKNISCVCDNPCSETVYSKSTSFRQWPTDQYAFVLLDGVCKQNVQACQSIRGENDRAATNNNFIKLNIFFEDLNYEQIQEEADISQAQLLSDVGGAIGLWIGLSILSFCEIIQLFFEIMDFLFYKLRRPRQKRRNKRRQFDSVTDSPRRQGDKGHREKEPPTKKRVPIGVINSHYGFPTRFINMNENEYKSVFNEGKTN